MSSPEADKESPEEPTNTMRLDADSQFERLSQEIDSKINEATSDNCSGHRARLQLGASLLIQTQ